MNKKINASDYFPHTLPYETIYAERVPLLHIFRTAVSHLYQERYGKGNSFKHKIASFLELFFNAEQYLAAECGVYLGNGLMACAEIAKESNLPIHFYGLDTFSGLPPLSETDKMHAPEQAVYRQKTLFADTSVVAVQESINRRNLTDYITLVPGLFQDTLSSLPQQKYFFVNIDCDLYEPHLECLEFFYPLMEKGGIIFFDDYYSVDYPMASLAINKFMKDRPEQLFHLRFGEDRINHTKTFIIKY